MSKIILFYQDSFKANNKDGYFYSDIIRWSDYRLEVEHDYIQWLFPDKTGGVNPLAPKLTEKDIEIFRTDKKIRRNVIKATSRMLQFYGYTFVKDGVFQIKELKRQEKGRLLGLYSEHNYKRLTRMMTFLNKIKMRMASSLIMLALCYAMHKDLVLRQKIKDSGALKYWFQTQKYLRQYIDIYDINTMGIHEEPYSSEEEERPVCRFTGLNYTGMSCYQDSTLLALFAIPNEFISKNILRKDLSNMPNKEIICSENPSIDLQRRSAIQRELLQIARSMRGELPEEKKVQYCSNLRILLRFCPSASGQAFYGTGTQDAGEFLQYLFAIFNVGGVIRARTVRVTNDLGVNPKNTLVVNNIIEQSSPVILISSHIIRENPSTDIKFFLNSIDDAVFDEQNKYRASDGKLYRRRIEQTTIATGDYLVFYAQRLYVERNKQVRTYNEILPAEKIKLDKNLQLFSVVVHRHEHYTAYIKCDNHWFYYNDLDNRIVPVGTYQDMLREKTKPNIKTEGVLYFYKA